MDVFSSEVRSVGGRLVKGILEGCKVDQNPELQQVILARFNFDFNNPPVLFPYNKYLEIVDYISAILYPKLEIQAAYEEIGYRSVMIYFDSPAGQVLKVAAGLLGPQRGAKLFVQTMYKRIPWANYEIEELSRYYIRLRVRGLPGNGGIMRGSLKASLEVAGGKLKKMTTTILGVEDIIHELELF